jgi:mono/diheme cytochrome c family protein
MLRQAQHEGILTLSPSKGEERAMSVKGNEMKIRLAALAAAMCMMTSPLFADGAQDMGAGAMNRGGPFSFQGGRAIFTNVCQGCHMPQAQGAVGAGMYPALAKDAKLEVAGYPVAVITHGQKAMPAFGPLLNDQQIADVVNYVRSNFGNKYKDKVKPEDVKAQR